MNQPHTPLVVEDQLFFAESAAKKVFVYTKTAPDTWNFHAEISMPGYTRGLALQGGKLLVGISSSRNVSRSRKTTVADTREPADAAVMRVDLETRAADLACDLGAFAREVYAFDEVGLFDESLRTTQDYDLWFKMATRFPFEHVSKVLVRARQHKDQGTHKLKGYVVREINDLYRRYLTTLTREEIAAYWPAGACSYFRATAMSMWKRGYRKAAGCAALMACRHLYGATIGQALHGRSRSRNAAG